MSSWQDTELQKQRHSTGRKKEERQADRTAEEGRRRLQLRTVLEEEDAAGALLCSGATNFHAQSVPSRRIY